jgi:Flp pilus assembly protein TadB
MEKDNPIESGSLTDQEKYELRIEPKANPGELQKLPFWYLWPVLIPLFLWMIAPERYGPTCFAAAAVLLFLGLWSMLRKERRIETTKVDRELVLYVLAVMSGGFAVASCLFLVLRAGFHAT